MLSEAAENLLSGRTISISIDPDKWYDRWHVYVTDNDDQTIFEHHVTFSRRVSREKKWAHINANLIGRLEPRKYDER